MVSNLEEKLQPNDCREEMPKMKVELISIYESLLVEDRMLLSLY